MKIALPKLAGLLGLVAVLTVNSAMGQYIHFRSNADSSGPAPAAVASDDGGSPFVPEASPATVAVDPVSESGDCSLCNQCQKTCRGCCGANCNECPGVGIELFSGVECWRNITTGDLQNNAGPVMGGNIGIPIPELRDYGFGAQLGARYSAADLDGRETFDGNQIYDSNEAEQQVFITAGIFRRAYDSDSILSRFSMGIAHDWMITSAYGDFAQSPYLGQWRGQVGFALNTYNEVGVGGSLRDRTADKFDANGVAVDYRAINQVSLFWHHTFCSGANSWLSFGIPERTTFPNADGSSNGSLGEFTLGANLLVPIAQRWALYADAMYMRPSATASAVAAIEDEYSIGFGVVFYPGGNSRTRNVAGNCWMPYLPVANNGTFLVDSNREF
jgi:hypothetical protein